MLLKLSHPQLSMAGQIKSCSDVGSCKKVLFNNVVVKICGKIFTLVLLSLVAGIFAAWLYFVVWQEPRYWEGTVIRTQERFAASLEKMAPGENFVGMTAADFKSFFVYGYDDMKHRDITFLPYNTVVVLSKNGQEVARTGIAYSNPRSIKTIGCGVGCSLDVIVYDPKAYNLKFKEWFVTIGSDWFSKDWDYLTWLVIYFTLCSLLVNLAWNAATAIFSRLWQNRLDGAYRVTREAEAKLKKVIDDARASATKKREELNKIIVEHGSLASEFDKKVIEKAEELDEANNTQIRNLQLKIDSSECQPKPDGGTDLAKMKTMHVLRDAFFKAFPHGDKIEYWCGSEKKVEDIDEERMPSLFDAFAAIVGNRRLESRDSMVVGSKSYFEAYKSTGRIKKDAKPREHHIRFDGGEGMSKGRIVWVPANESSSGKIEIIDLNKNKGRMKVNDK